MMIITFGDSTTALRDGVDVYTDQLARRFQPAYSDCRFMNKGVPGNTTALARQRFADDVLSFRPQVVILQFGINDSAVDVWKAPPETHGRVSLSDYEGNLRFFIEEIQRSGGEAILMTPNQLRWSPETKSLYNRPPYDVDNALGFTRVLHSYVEVARTLARESSTFLVDVFALYDEWEETHGISCSALMLDGMHPNTQGHTLVAEALEPLLRKHF